MKPTVSVRMNGAWRGLETSRAVGSSVTKSWSAAVRVGAREAVEQRRLARVGVADEGDHGHAARPCAGRGAGGGAPARARARSRIFSDAVADHAPVGLELRLAGAPRADAAAQALEVLPLPDEARQQVGELGQLDLELALHGARALGEDVEDERGAVDDLAARASRRGCAPGRATARRRRSSGRRRSRSGQRLDLLDLALAEVERGRRRLALLGDAGPPPRPPPTRRGGPARRATPPPRPAAALGSRSAARSAFSRRLTRSVPPA